MAPLPTPKPEVRILLERRHFSNWVRDEREHIRIADCIECNPVEAGLAGHAADHPWSSANPEQRLDTIVEAADTRVCATPGKLQSHLS